MSMALIRISDKTYDTVVVAMDMNERPNRLIGEKSPYLLQHAFNPVDWHPWGEEAFRKAEEQNKPIFLSIGYSTCHWCHVMEHESFRDSEIAEMLNDAFICVKVDREERPDIDGIYMDVCNLMTGKGGWPLSIIMTPDKKPFFAATYIPKDRRFGYIGLRELIPEIRKLWVLRRSEAMIVSQQIARAIAGGAEQKGEYVLDEAVVTRAFEQLAARYDRENGGFGKAPRFPSAHNLLFLLRYWKQNGNPEALEMVENTLHKMASGGLYDHIGSGFHRYSTDAEWLKPHFEKMLYDQAMQAMVYTEAFAATGENRFREIAEAVFGYVLRDMTSPGGAFYSAEDADSEDREGKFYLWSLDELFKVLGPEDGALMADLYGVTAEGNFPDEMTGSMTGENILHMREPFEKSLARLGIEAGELKRRLSEAREKLFTFRNARAHPFKDDKVLTDWNGLMIAALARGGRVFGDDSYVKAAEAAMGFLLKEHLTPDGRLLHRSRDGAVSIKGNLDDYASLIWALIELYEATYRVDCLRKAAELTDTAIRLFWDARHGGFFFTPSDGEELLAKKKELYDGAYPSGNSVMMMNLLLMSRLTGSQSCREKADLMAGSFSADIVQSPVAYTHVMSTLTTAIWPSFGIVVSAGENGDVADDILGMLRKAYLPESVVLYRNGESAELAALAPFTGLYEARNGMTTVYVCSGSACVSPVFTCDALMEALRLNRPADR